VLSALQAYAPDTHVVLDVGLGHTGPRLVIPHGGALRLDGPARRTTVTH
jgi:muramoyltetrapeptide carboxypeptidase LdcA involved in peptidoglycan recycling